MWCPWCEKDNGGDNRICLKCLNQQLEVLSEKPKRKYLKDPAAQREKRCVLRRLYQREYDRWTRYGGDAGLAAQQRT
jgi:hypothetical protein